MNRTSTIEMTIFAGLMSLTMGHDSTTTPKKKIIKTQRDAKAFERTGAIELQRSMASETTLAMNIEGIIESLRGSDGMSGQTSFYVPAMRKR